MMKQLTRLLRARKGVSIAEVVVAMASVLIVTAAAVTMVAASVKANVGYERKFRALIACENAAEVLRFAQNEADLANALTKIGFKANGTEYTLSYGDEQITVTKDDGDEDNYVVIYNGSQIYHRAKP